MKNNTNPLTESYPAQRVSDDLRMRVKRLAAQHDDSAAQKAQTLRKRRLVLSYGAAAAVVIGGIALQPRIATATALSRMSAAVEGVQTAHILSWQTRSVTDPTPTESETWFAGNSVRLKSERGVQIFSNGKNYFYSPERNRVVMKSAEGAAQFNSSGFSVAALKRDIARWGWTDRIETLGTISENGRSYKKFALYREEPAGKVRIIFWVDPATDLPQRSELGLWKDGHWEVFGGSELRYNETLDAKLFEPKFPGATIVDYDAEKKHWQAALENSTAQLKLGERTVKIRDVRVNEQGAIFVLYTCGKTYEDAFHRSSESADWWSGTPRDWSVSLRDDQGVLYTQREINFEGYVGKERKRMALGNRPILKEGELLQGDWFIPTTPQPRAPQSVRLRFHADPKNLHGEALNKAHGSRFTQLSENGDEFRQSWSATGDLTVSPEPQSGFLPDYWPHIVALISDGETELRQQFEATRSDALEKHRATLPDALTAIQAEEALTPEPGAQLLLKKARVLGLLKRPTEATQALQAALVSQAREVERFPQLHQDDYFFWEQVCTAWYAIGDDAKAIEAREKAMALSQRSFPGRVKWYREHPEDLKPKLD